MEVKEPQEVSENELLRNEMMKPEEVQRPEYRSGRILTWDKYGTVPSLPQGSNGRFFIDLFAQHKENVAWIDGETGKSYSYGDLRKMVLQLQSGLEAVGLKSGDTILVAIHNHIYMPALMYSTMLIGATCACIYCSEPKEGIINKIRISNAKWVVCKAENLEKTEAALLEMGLNILQNVWVVDDGNHVQTSRPSFGELLKFPESSGQDDDFNPATTACRTYFSSGTTGLSKAIVHSHHSFMANAMGFKYNARNCQFFNEDIFKRTLIDLPISHLYGSLIMNYTFLSGGMLVVYQDFEAEDYLEAILKYNITVSPLKTHQIMNLVENIDEKKHILASLKAILFSSSPMNISAMNILKEKTGIHIFQSLGSSEVGNFLTLSSDSNMASVGKLIPFYEAKVVDVNTGKLLGEGEQGELCFRSPYPMLGYVNNPKATSETIDSDGWIHMGDCCYYDEQDFIYVVDRIKDIINVAGFKVSPTELENFILQVEGVKEVAVAGVPHHILGEVPKAWVVPKEGASLDTKAIIRYVADRVVFYKQLAGGIQVVNALPRNNMSKVIRRELQNL